LEEAKNYINTTNMIDKPIGRISTDYTYHDYSGKKSNNQTSAPTAQMFKKNSQNNKIAPLGTLEPTQIHNKENMFK
jgi:hypothetical protein